MISVLAGAVGGALFGGAAGGLGWAGRSILGGVIGAEMAISAAIVEGNVTGKNPIALQFAEAGLMGMAFGALGGLYSDPNLNAGYLLGGTTPIGAEGSFTRTAKDGVFPFIFAQVPGDATSSAVGGFSCS